MTTIAIIDDDKQFSEAMSTYLSGRGYGTRCFISFLEATRYFSRKVDVILIDLNLGDGDGMELLKKVKNQNVQVKVIIMTGYDSLPKRLQSFALGADDYMKKPIFPSELEARIRRLVKKDLPVKSNNHLNDKLYTKEEQQILSLLLFAAGIPISLETLTERTERTKAAVYTCVCRLKNKVQQKYVIKTAYGRGWYIESIVGNEHFPL